VKASIVATEDGRTILDPDAATLAKWALQAHEAQCHECGNPNSDTRCPAGEKYLAATQTDRSWVPTPRLEA
jgi:hypothetical protein